MRRAKRPSAILLFAAVAYLGLFLILPLVLVFGEAFSQGVQAYLDAISTPDSMAAIYLTFLTVLVVVPINVIFGVAAAWLIARFDFRGRKVVLTLIDLPLGISPVITGMLIMFMCGKHGLLGSVIDRFDLKIVFAFPGIALATTLVTLPFIARELIPVLLEQGSREEEAALVLGASGWQMFWRITMPNIRWGLLYGVILCVTRAMGEFGAVSVVSGHLRGITNTVPLHVEILYNEYQFTAAFAVASLLTFFALVSLIVKQAVAWKAAEGLRS